MPLIESAVARSSSPVNGTFTPACYRFVDTPGQEMRSSCTPEGVDRRED